MVTYDARRHHARCHHVGTRLAVGAGDVMMVHGTQRSVWSLGLEMDVVIGRSRVLVRPELLGHLEVGCCWLSWKLDCLVLRRVCVEAVGSCGAVVDEDVVDACRGAASRVVVDLTARWGGRRGDRGRRCLVTLGAFDTLFGLVVRSVACYSVGCWRSGSLIGRVAVFVKILFRGSTDRNSSDLSRFSAAPAFAIGGVHIRLLRVTAFGVCKVGW